MPATIFLSPLPPQGGKGELEGASCRGHGPLLQLRTIP